MKDMLIYITKERLAFLLRIEQEYFALHSAGVDNWEGYGEIDWQEVEELVDSAIEELG